MIKPVSIFAYFAFEPFRKLPQVIHELTVKILDAPFNLALVLRIRRMSKMCLNTVAVTPVSPLISKLRSMITQNSFRKSANSLQYSHGFSRRQVMVKLLRRDDEPAVVVDAHQKPDLLTLNTERSFEVNLPQLIGTLGSEELPSLKLALVTILPIP